MAGLRGALMVRFERGVMWDVLNRMDRWCVEVGVNELRCSADGWSLIFRVLSGACRMRPGMPMATIREPAFSRSYSEAKTRHGKSRIGRFSGNTHFACWFRVLPSPMLHGSEIRNTHATTLIARQIEFWAKLGRAMEALLRGVQALALSRAGAARPISECLESADSSKWLRRTLKETPGK